MDTQPIDVDIVIPVYNEEAQLAASVRTLRDFLQGHSPYTYQITIADNASTDGTPAIARALAAEYPDVGVLRLEQKGRGRALRAAWSAGTALVVCYMDVDLSTDLRAFLPLVDPLVGGTADLAIGSRLARESVVARSIKREILSRGYNLLIRLAFRARFRDAQCGFKAGRREVVQALLPLIENQAWFFDTELLLLAEHNGLHLVEVPVVWTEDPDTRVDLRSTIAEDLRGLRRVHRTFRQGRGRLPAPRPVPQPAPAAR